MPPSDGNVIVVVPCHNEALTLPALVADLAANCASALTDLRVLAVDDGSTDATWSVINDLSSGSGVVPMQGLRLSRNVGKAAAQAAGIRAACRLAPTSIALMDADGQHAAEDLRALIASSETVDAVSIGRRVHYRRSVASAIGTRALVLASRLLGAQYDPATSEFMVLPRHDAERLARDPHLGLLPIVPLVERTARYTEYVDVFIRPPADPSRRSKWRLSTLGQKALLHLFANPWALLPRLSLLVGLGAVSLALYALVVGLISIVSGTFLGIASVLMALVAVFLILAMVSVLILGLNVLLLAQQQERGDSGDDA